MRVVNTTVKIIQARLRKDGRPWLRAGSSQSLLSLLLSVSMLPWSSLSEESGRSTPVPKVGLWSRASLRCATRGKSGSGPSSSEPVSTGACSE